VAEQRYQAVLAVIKDGRTIKEVAGQWSVSRQTLHAWLARHDAKGAALAIGFGFEMLASQRRGAHRPGSNPGIASSRVNDGRWASKTAKRASNSVSGRHLQWKRSR
jgi:transposase